MNEESLTGQTPGEEGSLHQTSLIQEATSGRSDAGGDDGEPNENEGADPMRDAEEYEQGQRPTKPDKG